eukprot:gnl/TRDRNA2_/TRDRNA2_183251_c0_seq1.p1 gnl/TRDRNA2_/TRDRNA2_183251_c0~~gnl/TRDRNA2_/TRDRNA2_183251_c0_seq1.p1  ORF type:complete len:303 (+),score=51.41 gnl/TRDRNA2_/TRDRNA2_183251_c0_seq1:76-984(+)
MPTHTALSVEKMPMGVLVPDATSDESWSRIRASLYSSKTAVCPQSSLALSLEDESTDVGVSSSDAEMTDSSVAPSTWAQQRPRPQPVGLASTAPVARRTPTSSRVVGGLPAPRGASCDGSTLAAPEEPRTPCRRSPRARAAGASSPPLFCRPRAPIPAAPPGIFFKPGTAPRVAAPPGLSQMAAAPIRQPPGLERVELRKQRPLDERNGCDVAIMVPEDASPMKVWLPEHLKRTARPLDPSLPAKKKPVYSEFAGADFEENVRLMDPSMPAKKRVTKFLLRDLATSIGEGCSRHDAAALGPR